MRLILKAAFLLPGAVADRTKRLQDLSLSLIVETRDLSREIRALALCAIQCRAVLFVTLGADAKPLRVVGNMRMIDQQRLKEEHDLFGIKVMCIPIHRNPSHVAEPPVRWMAEGNLSCIWPSCGKCFRHFPQPLGSKNI